MTDNSSAILKALIPKDENGTAWKTKSKLFDISSMLKDAIQSSNEEEESAIVY